MSRWPLGVFVSCDAGLGLPLEMVQAVGVPTVHLHSPQPQSRTAETAARLKSRLRDLRIEPTCLFAGFPGESYADIPTVKNTVGLAPRTTRAQRLAELKQIAQFARMLEIDAVGLHVGFIPHDVESEDFGELVAALREVCRHCANLGQAVHLETGQEPADILLAFIQRTKQDNLFVNFDPANMVLYGSSEPLAALEAVAPYVRSVHCKDARWSDKPGQTWGVEVPLGEGDVDIAAYVQLLVKLGYLGPLTIEREIPQTPERQKAEIMHAVTLLSQILHDIEGTIA